jgi:hypothetical protein
MYECSDITLIQSTENLAELASLPSALANALFAATGGKRVRRCQPVSRLDGPLAAVMVCDGTLIWKSKPRRSGCARASCELVTVLKTWLQSVRKAPAIVDGRWGVGDALKSAT